jgi:hypothetical protein
MTAFLVWMLGYPLVSLVQTLVYERFLGRTYSEGVRGVAAILDGALWLWVGVLLWRRTG